MLVAYVNSKGGVGKPEGKLVLNRMRTRDTISRELKAAAPSLGLSVAAATVRDLQPFRDAAQQGTVVTRMPPRAKEAAKDVTKLFEELILELYETSPKAANE